MAINFSNGTTLSTGSTGKVLQVQSTIKKDDPSGSFSGYNSITVMSVDITPSSASNKIYGWINCANDTGGNHNATAFIVTRNGSQILVGDAGGSRTRVAAAMEYDASDHKIPVTSLMFVDDGHNSTNSITYALKMFDANGDGGDYYINRQRNDANGAGTLRATSQIVVMEVAA
tara:strand:- start:59 stop:577 length:519 start_codon:yes stop_codon:yes gene_type:complete